MSSLPEDTHWAVTEFAEADLGDERRTHRLVALASVLAQHPPRRVARSLWGRSHAQSGLSLL